MALDEVDGKLQGPAFLECLVEATGDLGLLVAIERWGFELPGQRRAEPAAEGQLLPQRLDLLFGGG